MLTKVLKMSQSLNLISINYNISDESENNANKTEVLMNETNRQECNDSEVFVEDIDNDRHRSYSNRRKRRENKV